MGESLIIRKGGGLPGGIKVEKVFKTEIIRGNQEWEVPSGLINNSISVFIFGGGGGASEGGGGGGWMNNGIITVTPKEKISIVVGRGGSPSGNSEHVSGTAGGSTIFGKYLSANGGGGGGGGTYGGPGGSGGSGGGGGGGSDGGSGGTGYQFGGGSAQGTRSYGGDGGKWGGGGAPGGSGGYYGGGAGGGKNSKYLDPIPGNGGYYGGGGGAGINTMMNNSLVKGGIGGCINVRNVNEGISGLCGNGGDAVGSAYPSYVVSVNRATDGTNTSTWTNVYYDEENKVYFRGAGKAGSLDHGELSSLSSRHRTDFSGAGGGGFGGNGGSLPTPHWYNYDDSDSGWINTFITPIYGGGGGGYGSNGGNASFDGAGGGGGFGGDGGSNGGAGGGYGKSAKGGEGYGSGGGGYYAPGGIGGPSFYGGGGGGGYGINGAGGAGRQNGYSGISANGNGGIGAGGGAMYNDKSKSRGFGGDGICIIQYYTWDLIM